MSIDIAELRRLAEAETKGERFIAGWTAGKRGWEVGNEKTRNRRES